MPLTTSEPQRDAQASSAEGATGELRQRAASGAVWAMLGFGGAQLLRFAGNLVVTRLVAPEVFGLMVLVNTFLMGLALFSDLGIGLSVIQSKRGEERDFLNTAWSLSIVRGVGLTAVAALGAWPMAVFYDQPELLGLIPASALSSTINGAASMRLVTANRQLRLARLTLVELASQAVGLGAMIGLAVLYPSPWALVNGGLAGAAARTALSFFVFPPPYDRWRWEPTAVREIFTLGKWVLLSTALMFAANYVDRFVFGKIVALETLGLYHQATQLAAIPAGALTQLGQSIVLPLLSAIALSGGDLPHEFRRARWAVLVAGGWAVAALVVGGPAAVAFLFPDIYAPAAPMLQILALGSWFGVVLAGPNGAALLAQGQTKWVAAASGAKLIVTVPALLAGAAIARALGGDDATIFHGALIGLAASEGARYLVATLAIRRLGLTAWGQDAGLTLLLAGSVLVGIGALRVVQPWCAAAGEALAGSVGDALAALHPKLALTPARAAAAVEGVAAALVVTATWAPLLWRLYRRRKASGR